MFTTKYRRKIFNNEILNAIPDIFRKIAASIDVEIIACDGEADHVHSLIAYGPSSSISDIAFRLKGSSSFLLRGEFATLRPGKHLWSPSYFVASVGGAPLDIVRRYVENQRE